MTQANQGGDGPKRPDRRHATIDGADLLPGVEAEVVQKVLVAGTLKNVAAGTVIMKEGSPDPSFVILLKGAVKVSHNLDDGRQIVNELRRAPSFFGHVETLAQIPTLASVDALEFCQVLEVPRPALAEALKTSDKMMTLLVAEDGRRLARAAYNQRALANDATEKRLARLLLSYLELFGLPIDGGIKIRVPLTQDELGDALAVNRRSIIRALQEWKDRNLVFKSGDSYAVSDPKALEEIAKK
ncbi:MAG: Crp/Fnr family transcriptional regulator [Deltaproteobacteria bacterium]|nr:Crp/Fnr family transcriptional regulator [Deltaproteobacteria bacterium]